MFTESQSRVVSGSRLGLRRKKRDASGMWDFFLVWWKSSEIVSLWLLKKPSSCTLGKRWIVPVNYLPGTQVSHITLMLSLKLPSGFLRLNGLQFPTLCIHSVTPQASKFPLQPCQLCTGYSSYRIFLLVRTHMLTPHVQDWNITSWWDFSWSACLKLNPLLTFQSCSLLYYSV